MVQNKCTATAWVSFREKVGEKQASSVVKVQN